MRTAKTRYTIMLPVRSDGMGALKAVGTVLAYTVDVAYARAVERFPQLATVGYVTRQGR